MQFLFKGNPFVSALAGAVMVAYLLFTFYVLSEPAIVNGQSSVTEDVVVTQEITGEISLTVASTTMQMDGAIAGVTGGSSRATTTLNVVSNNVTGYNLTIQFEDAVAMQQDGGTGFIDNYDPTSVSNGDFDMSVGAGEAAFAYTISGIATDMDAKFLGDGSTTCDSGTQSTPGQCWYNVGVGAATGAVTLINRATSTTAGGATSTLNFQVQVGNGSTLETGFYTATSTLTATEN